MTEGARTTPAGLAGPLLAALAVAVQSVVLARLYPAGSEPAHLTLDFVRDGKIVGRAQPPLPAPDAGGRIAYVGGVPSSGFPPGAYEVRLTLAQGARSATSSTRFEIVP